MGKTGKLFKALSLILKQPSLLNKVLDDEDVNRKTVISKYGLAKGLSSVDISDLLPGMDVTVEPYGALEGGSTPIDLALLKGLAASIPDCHYFEIGTWRGESVANVAAAATRCFTLNLPDETILSMGGTKEYAGLHRHFSKQLDNVTHLQGNSLTFDYSSYRKKFDLVFIDGDHHYETVKNDTEKAFELIKNENSIIIWHDYGHDPSDIRWDVFRGILDGTPAASRKHLYRVSNTLCAIYTNRALRSGHSKPHAVPDKHFSITVKTVKA
ncbi:MAG: class I SAM-dependent methyltransferase [Bacteroidia bacterium]